jgi:hypothetical protein
MAPNVGLKSSQSKEQQESNHNELPSKHASKSETILIGEVITKQTKCRYPNRT